MLERLKYIILGLIQGITEPLPISSSGHIIIFEHLFGLELPDLNYEIILNFGSLIAIIIFYFADIKSLVISNYRYVIKKDKKELPGFTLLLKIIIGVIPAGLIGFLFKDYIELYFKSLLTIGISLILTGIFLRNVTKKQTKVKEITYNDAMYIGIYQIIALIPGISRSGFTMMAGMKRHIDVKESLKFSFFMYIPISIGTIILALFDLKIDTSLYTTYAMGFLLSSIVTYFSLKIFIKLISKKTLNFFAIYCLTLGIFLFIYSLLK